MSFIELEIREFFRYIFNTIGIDEKIEIALNTDFVVFNRFRNDVDNVTSLSAASSQPQIILSTFCFFDQLFAQME